ncbi:sensor histidine kinase [Bacillus solitudinis]|uniref:sensor histidine kinase n=1 Tax=Bacillus solitudinis TaxID=2014074 RepID=UPI0018E1F7D8|nr:sensor histidine kinase [Bacillus solitudinis]
MKIKTKMTLSVVLIITVALLFSGAYTYSFFSDILIDQVMKDESTKLNQTAEQIRYIQDDIQQFTQYILVDDEIQSRINKIYSSNDYYQNLINKDWLSKKLKSYLLLKDYIDSVVLVSKDKTVISSDNRTNEYYKTTLNESWYKEFIQRDVYSGFSTIHPLQSHQKSIGAISYIVPFNSILNPESKLHYLIVNIDLTHFIKMINNGKTEYETISLIDSKNSSLYTSNQRLTRDVEIVLSRVNQELSYQEENTTQIINVNQSMNDGWKLVTIKSKRTVLEQIDFIFSFILATTVVSIFLILVILTPILLNITKPIIKLTQAMKRVSMGDLNTKVTISSKDEIETLGNGFNQMVDELRTYISQSIKDEQIKQKLQMDLLRSQINPHFIYNTLNTVIYMAQKQGNQDIVKMMESFIGLLQDAIKEGTKGYFVTLKEEMEIVEHYIVIQEFRYPNRFEVLWDIEPTSKEIYIPRTILQPLVENALFHGIVPNMEVGTIRIISNIEREQLVIKVKDNGVGINEEIKRKFNKGLPISESGAHLRPIGLTNVRDRILRLYDKEASIEIENSVEGGMNIIIRLPIKETGFYTI